MMELLNITVMWAGIILFMVIGVYVLISISQKIDKLLKIIKDS